MNGSDILIILTVMLTVTVVVKFALVRATGCYCELTLDDIVDEEDEIVAVYNGVRDNIPLQVTRTCLSGEIPQSIRVTADRLGNVYTDKQYTALIAEVIVMLTLTAIAILLKAYLLM